MNTSTNSNRFLQLLVILLIVLNGVVLFILFKGKGHPPHPPGSQLKFRLIEELDMSKEQEMAYNEMVDRHRVAMDSMRTKENETRTALYETLSNTQPQQDSLYSRLGELKISKEKITFAHFGELRGILTEKQTKKFDDIIKEAVNGMEAPPKR